MSLVPAAEFAQRRATFLEKIRAHNSIAILPASPEVSRTGDSHFPYRQHSDFYYLTGFDEPEAVAVFLPGHAEGEYWLFNRRRDPAMELWNGRRAGQAGAKEFYGANQAYPTDEFTKRLPELLSHHDVLYYAFGRHAEFDATILQALNDIRAKVRAGVAAPQTLINPEIYLHEMRLHKSAAEIITMRRAMEMSIQGHIKAMQLCRPGKYEYELEAALMQEFIRHGSRAPAYQPIVGAGDNSCILHYHENNKMIEANDIVLIDAGAEFENYAADITRSFPANGRFSAEQRAIYDIVLAAQAAGIEQVKPGNPWPAVQQAIVRAITQGLVDLKILQGNVDDLIARKAYQAFYMHNSGHWLGLDTHDVGAYKISQEWRTLAPGMVLTVEPGIYISASIPDVAEKWHNIGIRIEDDVLVTPDGHDVLTQALPKQIADIEALMHG